MDDCNSVGEDTCFMKLPDDMRSERGLSNARETVNSDNTLVV